MSGINCIFLGTEGGFSPQTVVITATGAGTQTVPSGATNVIIEIWGGGGAGGQAFTDSISIFNGGGAGGCGGYSRSSYACSGGQTINYSVGAGGANSTATSGTLTITSMTASFGFAGGDADGSQPGTGAAGGPAVGGNAANTTGASGGNGNTSAGGGIAGNATAGIFGTLGGQGANGADVGNSPDPGQPGKASFRYT